MFRELKNQGKVTDNELRLFFPGMDFGTLLTLNERLTRDAWDAYYKNNYQAAIAIANECLDEFEQDASKEQDNLLEAISKPHI
jgi:hypothetical protein